MRAWSMHKQLEHMQKHPECAWIHGMYVSCPDGVHTDKWAVWSQIKLLSLNYSLRLKLWFTSSCSFKPILPSASIWFLSLSLNTVTKSILGGEKGLFYLTFSDNRSSLQEVGAGAQGRNLGAGTEAETMEEHWLLACSPWLAQCALM